MLPINIILAIVKCKYRFIMRRYVVKICLTLGLFVIVGCSFKPNYLHLALDMAGDNRAELENVLEYYKDDPLKYEPNSI